MNYFAANWILGTPLAELARPRGVEGDEVAKVVDYYCAKPDCDCREVMLLVKNSDLKTEYVRVFHRFGVPLREATLLARGAAPANVATRWFEALKPALLTTRAQIAVFEVRYFEVKATLHDPMRRGHSVLRNAAGLAPIAIPASRYVGKGRRAGMLPPPLRDLKAEARAVLELRGVSDVLSGAELMALAMASNAAKELTADAAVRALFANGAPERNPRKLAQRIVASSRDTGAFARPEEERFVPLPRILLEQRLDAILARSEVNAALAARPATMTTSTAEAPKPAQKKRDEPVSAAPLAPSPSAPPSQPAPGFAPAPRTLPALSSEIFEALLAGRAGTVEDVRLALDAQRLASAAQFDELLALATMRDVTPHKYQTETVRRVLRALRGRAILADEVGLGKTVEALMVLREYQVRSMVRRALVLVPAALVGQWAGELAQKAGVVARTTDDPRVRDEPEAFWGEAGVVVASLALARGAKHAPIVQAAPWDLVIVDEAHHIKNRTTLGYKLVSALKHRFLLLLTATPVENDLEEIYNLVTLLKPGQFDTPAAFRKRFVDPKDPTRPRDRDSLRALLGEVMVRNTRAQSGLALPPRFVSTVAVDPSPGERELYEAVVTFVRAWHEDPGLALAASALLLEAGSSPRAVRATLDKMRAKRQGRDAKRLRDDLETLSKIAGKVEGTRKVEALLQILATQRDPVLVFTRFRETLDEVVAGVERAGVTAVAFHGGLDERARRAALERFRAGGAVVMVATAAGSEGHNLQHCNVLVNFDLPWNPMAIEQRIGRLHRMGQTREVHVYNLCARGTIEERVLDVLDRRVQLFQLVVGEMDMVLGNIADERDLEDWLVASVARAKSDADVDATFDRLADDLLAARGRYEKTRALDDALFGKDFEA